MKCNNKFLPAVALGACIFFGCITALVLADETPNWKVEKIPGSRDSIYGTISGLPNLQAGDPVAVFDAEGNCYGTGEFDGIHFWLSMFMNEEADPAKPGDITVPGFKPGDEVVFKAYSKKEDKEYTLKPSSGEPYLYEPHGAFPPTELDLVYGEEGDGGGDDGDGGSDVVPPGDDVTPPEGDSATIEEESIVDEESVSGPEQVGSIIIAAKPKTEEGAEETEEPFSEDLTETSKSENPKREDMGKAYYEEEPEQETPEPSPGETPSSGLRQKEAHPAMPNESEYTTLKDAPPARLKLEGRKPLLALGAELPVIKALVHMPLAAKVFLFIIIPVLLLASATALGVFRKE